MLLLVLFSAIVPVGIIGGLLLVAMTIGQKREPDPGGKRPYVVYLLAVSFVSLTIIVVGGTLLAQSLARLGLDDTGSSASLGSFDSGDDFSGGQFSEKILTGEAIQTALIVAAAVALLVFHSRRFEEERASGVLEGGATGRTYATYLYVLCSLTAIVAAIAAAVAVFAVIKVVAPGSVAVGDPDRVRDSALVTMITSGALAAATGYLFQTHWVKVAAIRTGSGGEPAPSEEV